MTKSKKKNLLSEEMGKPSNLILISPDESLKKKQVKEYTQMEKVKYY